MKKTYNLSSDYKNGLKSPKNKELHFGKLPPQAIDLENAIIGAMMLSPKSMDEVFSIIKTDECFYLESNQIIFSAIRQLYENGSRIDFLTVSQYLRKTGQLDEVGGSYAITKLTDGVTNSNPISEYSRIVLEKYMKREIINIAADLLSESYDDTSDVFELMGKSSSMIDKIMSESISSPFKHIGQGVEHDIHELNERIEKANDSNFTLSGVDTGFRTVNNITNGWQKCDLIILAARPSVGKTAFGLNLAMNAAMSKEKPTPVGFFSLEMDMPKLRLRIMSAMTHVGMTNINSGRVDDTEIQRLTGNLHKVKKLPIYIDDSFVLTTMEMKAKARMMIQKHGVGLIIVDYLQLMKASSDRNIREQQISQISRDLKGMAKELNVPIIALSQLSRDIEKRENKEPQLADLRESGAIEQDADLVSFLYRHDDKINWKLAKHRNGKIDTVQFNANLDIQLFTEVGEDNPSIGYRGYNATPMSQSGGNFIPLSQANKQFDDEALPF
jgi:replicative DNA helicase